MRSKKNKPQPKLDPKGKRVYPEHHKRFKGEIEILPLWQQVYNLIDGKVFRMSYDAYYEQGTNYTLPDEVHDMVKMLGQIDENTPREQLEQFAAYAVSPAVNQKIYGSTL